eukprot:CAMPEP_0203935534 /NCGR_PEP_ID=MMETSP0359-20131031/73271_1 /ASSEMBLY_ACC=CAM_ASM_000338 /TAXON_ID=268821 /ORGANISM="Scrippsiella Hangoei, Strain SHTV-5" /LENGTH=88 /DNA_ID=CAMNT_0050865393 /DNA_START=68 /DNA_END=330 /DNA_ORIENTATION=+
MGDDAPPTGCEGPPPQFGADQEAGQSEDEDPFAPFEGIFAPEPVSEEHDQGGDEGELDVADAGGTPPALKRPAWFVSAVSATARCDWA